MNHYDSYVICTSPRSGSTLLCKLLLQTGRAGNPGSWFHVPQLERWLDDYDLRPEFFPTRAILLGEVFARARAKGIDGKGLFGLRLQRHSASYFFDQLADAIPAQNTDVARLTAVFGRTLFIHLTRPDKLAQAVSFVKAEQTGLWHRAANGEPLEQLPPTAPLTYDEDRIAQQITRFEAFDQQWCAWFQAQKVSSLRISYDDLSSNPRGALAEVLHRLGLDPSLAADQVTPVAKLADTTNEDWIARFHDRALRD